MAVKAAKKTIPDQSTQRYLPFSQIRDNVIIMKDGSARVVLKSSAINFLLKSEWEQNAIIISFQRFLNSLDFPIQIIVRSTKVDIEWYLQNLNSLAVKQRNPLLQNQTYEYIEYLKKLIEVAQIMKKDFYVVVPIDGDEDNSVRDLSFMWKIKNFWASINWADTAVSIKSGIQQLNKQKKKLINRVNWVKTWLENIWVKTVDVDKTELVKLLHDYYNPRLENLNTLRSDITQYDLI